MLPQIRAPTSGCSARQPPHAERRGLSIASMDFAKGRPHYVREAPRLATDGYASPMSLLDRISIDPGVVHGRPAVRGTRMRVSDVLALLAAGADESEILEDYPYLERDDIRACLAFAAAQANHAIIAS